MNVPTHKQLVPEQNIRNDSTFLRLESKKFGFFTFSEQSQEQKVHPSIQLETKSQFDFAKHKCESIYLADCDVNIHALRRAIHKNVSSLREIIIINCRFYLSDANALKQENRTSNLRMFQQVNFDWLIKSLKFTNLDLLSIVLLKEYWSEDPSKFILSQTPPPPFEKTNLQIKNQSSKINVDPFSESQEDIDIDKVIHSINHESSKVKLINDFDCEENCEFLKYEQLQTHQDRLYFSKERVDRLSEQLIWGDLQVKENFWNKLYETILSDIHLSLQIYKKFTRFSFNGNRLIVTREALENMQASNQLRNLIHMNCSKIECIIFKDTGHIRPAAFTELMNLLSLIPKLISLAFLQSVLDETNLLELKYFISEKKVKYLILFQSFFLQNEFQSLLNLTIPFHINHHRHNIIDLTTKNNYEFCPYQFELQELLQKTTDERLAIEQVFLDQRSYPKVIQEEIDFFIGRNMFLLAQSIADKEAFENQDFILEEGYVENYGNPFITMQQELGRIIERSIQEDRISILNYRLIKKYISMAINVDLQQKYNESLKSCKSYICLKSNFPEGLDIPSVLKCDLDLTIFYSYLRGFTRVKRVFQDFFFLNSFRVYDQLVSQYSFQKEYLNDGIRVYYNSIKQLKPDKSDEYVNVKILKDTFNIVNAHKFTTLKTHCNQYYNTELYLNQSLKEFQNLREFILDFSDLEENETEGIDLKGINSQLEQFVILYGQNSNLNFVSQVFQKCQNLKKLKFKEIKYNVQIAQTINFSHLSNTLQELHLSNIEFNDHSLLNDFFRRTINLIKLNLSLSTINSEVFNEIQFPTSLVILKLQGIQGTSLLNMFLKLGSILDFNLEELRISLKEKLEEEEEEDEAENESKGGNIKLEVEKENCYSRSLPGLNKIKSLQIGMKLDADSGPELLNMVLENTPKIEKISLNNVNWKTLNGSGIEDKANQLKAIKFRRFSDLSDVASLKNILRKAKNLERFEWMESNLEESNIDTISEEDIPDSIQFIEFFKTQFNSPSQILNIFLRKCQQLQEFIYDKGKLNIEELDIKSISPNLRVFVVDNYDQPIGNTQTLNYLLKNCQKLQKLSLNIEDLKDIIELDFQLAGRNLSEIKILPHNELDKQFKEWGFARSQILFNIRDYEEQVFEMFKEQNINYFDIVSSLKIPNEILKQRQWKDYKFRLFLMEIVEKRNNNNEEMNEEDNNPEKVTNHINFLNPYYFSVFIKQFLAYPLENRLFSYNRTILHSQNVLDSIDLDLVMLLQAQMFEKQKGEAFQYLRKQTDSCSAQIIYERKKCSDQLINMKMTDELLLKEKSIQYFMENCQYIEVLDFSYQSITQDTLQTFKPTKMESVVEINLSNSNIGYSQWSSYDVSPFFETIFLCCPNIKKLNLGHLKVSKNVISFKNLNKNLEALELSNIILEKQSRIYDYLGVYLNLKVMRLNSCGNIQNKFQLLSPELLELHMQNTKIDFQIDSCLKNYTKLQVLDLKNSQISDENLEQITFQTISTSLQKIAFFKLNGQQFSTQFYKLIKQLLMRCLELKEIDLTAVKSIIKPTTEQLFDLKNGIKVIKIRSAIQDQTLIRKIVENSTWFSRFEMNLKEVRSNQQQFSQEIEITVKKQTDQNEPVFDLSLSQNISKINFIKSLIPNSLMSDLNKCQNLKELSIESCELSFELYQFNELFKQTKQLEILRFINNEFKPEDFSAINFRLSPSSLIEVSFEQMNLTNFGFISDLFEASSNNLFFLSLRNCCLTNEFLGQIKFSNAGKSLKTISLLNNNEITSFEALRGFFEKGKEYWLDEIEFENYTYDQIIFLAEFRNQIDTKNIQLITITLPTFDRFELKMNIVDIILFLEEEQGKEDLQQLWKSGTLKGNCLKYLMKSLLSSYQQEKDTSVIQYYLFLLLLDTLNLRHSIIENQNFALLSPNSLIQQSAYQNNVKNYIHQNKSETIQSEYPATFDPNSYNLGIVGLQLLKNVKIQNIFGFEKHQFVELFPKFYEQPSQNKDDGINLLLSIYKSIGSSNGRARAFIPLELELTKDLLERKKLNELDLLLCINAIPPSTITLSGMSVQFIKSWYAISFALPLSVSTTIDIKYELIENSSIANFFCLHSFRLYIRNYSSGSVIKKIFGKIIYSFFSLFSSQAMQYRFDHTIIHLENSIRQSYEKGYLLWLTFLYIIQLFICIFAVWFFQLKENTLCGQTMPVATYIMYGIFGIITFIVEAIIFKRSLKYVSYLVPDIEPNCLVNFPNPIINIIKILIMDIKWINRWYANYLLSFVSSQLSRFDFLTNLGFLYSTYSCGDTELFLITLISLSVQNAISISIFISSLLTDLRKKSMITRNIDRLYQISSLLSFQSVAVMLDLISPTNSIVIFGKMFNQRIIQNFIRILVQDMPLIVVKTLFLLRHQAEGGSQIYPIISSGLMFLLSLNQFLSITPSVLGQADFNKLNENKKAHILPKYTQQLSRYDDYLTRAGFYETIKCIKSETYRRESLIGSEQTIKSSENVEKELFSILRQCKLNNETMKAIFGNSKIENIVPPSPPSESMIIDSANYNQKATGLNMITNLKGSDQSEVQSLLVV